MHNVLHWVMNDPIPLNQTINDVKIPNLTPFIKSFHIQTLIGNQRQVFQDVQFLFIKHREAKDFF